MTDLDERETDLMIEQMEALGTRGIVKASYAESCVNFLNDIRDTEYGHLSQAQAKWFDDIEDMIEEHNDEV